MFCGKVANEDLNSTHKRALRVSDNDYSPSFEELLQKSNECTIHSKNLQQLMLEVYKFINKETPHFMLHMFHEKSSQYDLRSIYLLMLPTLTLFDMEMIA